MVSAVSGVAGSVRVEQLTRAGITRAEKHGKRQDATGQARVVRQVEALTRTGFEVCEQFEAHVAGAFIPKAKAKAMHLLIQFPKDLVDPADAEGMLDHARAFCERVFGPDAIFADRIDLDERNTQVVDVFVAPKYLKVTKRDAKIAVSMTKHLKELAVKHGEPPLPYGMGRALQTELYHYFRDVMKLEGVQRGEEKVFAGPDWKSAEQERVEELESIESKREQERGALREAMIEIAQQSAALEAERAEVAAERERILAGAEEERRKLIGEGEGLKQAAIAAGEAERARLESAGATAKQSAIIEGQSTAREIEQQAERSRDQAAADEEAAAKKSHEAEEDRAKAEEARELAKAHLAKVQELRDLAEEASREATAEVAAAREERAKVALDQARMNLLTRVADPADELDAWVREGKLIFKGPLSDEEKVVIKSGFGEAKSVWYSIVPKLVSMDVRDWNLSEREREVKKEWEAVQALHKKLKDAWSTIQNALARASSFLAAWRIIPEAEQAPSIQTAIAQASELTALHIPDLTIDDLPPGYSLPGKGGFDIGG